MALVQLNGQPIGTSDVDLGIVRIEGGVEGDIEPAAANHGVLTPQEAQGYLAEVG